MKQYPTCSNMALCDIKKKIVKCFFLKIRGWSDS